MGIRAIDDESLPQAVRIVRSGGLVVIPTDTVYGIVCDPRNEEALRRLYALKHRPWNKALQVLLAGVDMLGDLDLRLPAPLDRLAAALMPGAFSPIAVAGPHCTLRTVSDDGHGGRTQGIRVPRCASALRVLEATGALAASSANLSGCDSARSVQEAHAAFGDEVDLYLDGGVTPGHVASTVVAADARGCDGIAILREGVIAESAIRAVLRIDGGGLDS